MTQLTSSGQKETATFGGRCFGVSRRFLKAFIYISIKRANRQFIDWLFFVSALVKSQGFTGAKP